MKIYQRKWVTIIKDHGLKPLQKNTAFKSYALGLAP